MYTLIFILGKHGAIYDLPTTIPILLFARLMRGGWSGLWTILIEIT